MYDLVGNQYMCFPAPQVLLPWPKHFSQQRMPNYRRVHARESTRSARGCLNFYGQGGSTLLDCKSVKGHKHTRTQNLTHKHNYSLVQ